MSTSLEISREDRVMRLTLNRPEKRNALGFALCRELADALDDAGRDPKVKAILLDAKGPVFCAGMDLDEALEDGAVAEASIHERLFTFGSRIQKPVVAAVSGAALGGGLGLVANPHVAVAAQGTSFGLTEIRIGMWPFVVFRSIAFAIGERRALELSLTGRIFGTQEALQWGLVQFVVPAFELDDRASEIAANLAAFSGDTIRRGLETVYASRGLDWTKAGELAAHARAEVFASDDFRAGVRAFREKRKP
jgi:enoyl-CoA hydratase/carnithine racemase